ncbi:MAG: hypothetical protein K6C32_02300 [Bacilli bacterium]|nr:hypothetical protein [Bacilli bacterium]
MDEKNIKESTNQETIKQENQEPQQTFNPVIDIKALQYDKPYYEVVEDERNNLLSQAKKSGTISRILLFLVLALGTGGIITYMNAIYIAAGICAGLAVALLITHLILSKRIARPDEKGYINNASAAIDSFVFSDTRFSDVLFDTTAKLELGDVYSDGVYAGLIKMISRNLVTGKFNDASFKICECALHQPGEKNRPEAAFIGKYMVFPNSLHFEGRILLISKGKEDVDLPTDLDGLVQVEGEDKFFAYALSEKSYKELSKKFISAIKKIDISNHLLNLNIAVWSGKTIVYASYDDATISLSPAEPFKREAQESFRKDLIQILEALDLIK